MLTLATLVVIPVSAGAEPTYSAPSAGLQWAAYGHGVGLGMGLSQYGARRRSASGQTPDQILDFYYPGTTAGTVSSDATILVRLTLLSYNYFTIAGAPGLGVRDDATGLVTPLPDTTAQYRATAPDSAPHTVQMLKPGSPWTDVPLAEGSGTTGPLTFLGPPVLRVNTGLTPEGYPGKIRISGSVIINEVGLDDYVSSVAANVVTGVVPNVPKATWSPAALRALATAAHTYAAYLHATPVNNQYDTCDRRDDKPGCTFIHYYPARYKYDAAGNATDLVPSAVLDAVSATTNQIRTYAGQPIDAEYGESNGGWTVAKPPYPYLVARPDPFDPAGNPDTTWRFSGNPTVYSPLFGDKVTIVHRDGHGQWGGRVTEMRSEFKNPDGSTYTQTYTGTWWLDLYQIPSAHFIITSGYPPVATPGGVSVNADPEFGHDVFAVGPTGEVWHRRWEWSFLHTWLDWTPLGGALKGSPTAIRLPDGSGARVFIRGGNDMLYTGYLQDDQTWYGKWHGWQRLGGTLASRPYPALLPNGTVLLFYKRPDGALGYATYRAGAVRSWTNLGGHLAGAPAAAANSQSGEVTVFIRGAGGGIYARSLVSGRWSSWIKLGGDTSGDLAASAPSWGVTDVYLRGAVSPYALYTRRVTNGQWGPAYAHWGPWVKIGGSLATGPYASDVGITTIWVLGTDHRAYLRQRQGNWWGPWTPFPP
jgi:SpoIID/LytB domain protein